VRYELNFYIIFSRHTSPLSLPISYPFMLEEEINGNCNMQVPTAYKAHFISISKINQSLSIRDIKLLFILRIAQNSGCGENTVFLKDKGCDIYIVSTGPYIVNLSSQFQIFTGQEIHVVGFLVITPSSFVGD
jgi:hypothetical protein